MKEEILAAVMFLIKFIEKSDSFPRDQIENFKHHLTTLLLERFEKHWFPERPARGQGYRCIRVNGVSPVDGTLERAASRCGLRYRDLRLPQELTVWVDPAEVCYRLGESEGSYCTLATFPLLGSTDGDNKTKTTIQNLSSLSHSTSLSNSSSSTMSSSSLSTSSTSSSSSASSEASSDCASLSSRSPSPLAATTAITAAPSSTVHTAAVSSVYQGPMRRSPFTVNGGGRFVRGVGAMQQQMGGVGSCRTAVSMQQPRFMQQQQQMGGGGVFNAGNNNGVNAGNSNGGNRLKPREMSYNVQQQHNMQQPQQAQSNNNNTNRTSTSTSSNTLGAWRCDGPPAFTPPMFNPLHFNPHHNGGGPHNNHFNPQFRSGNSSGSGNPAMAIGPNGPNGVASAYNNQRMYKNVVRV